MDDMALLESIHRIGRIECSDPDCRACPEHRKDALALIAKYRADARAEALREASEAISMMNQMSPTAIGDDYLVGYGSGVRECQVKLESILTDEPKENEADENNCPMIEAWVWPSGEWKIQAASAQQWKEHGIFQIVPIFSRAEVERKLKEADPYDGEGLLYKSDVDDRA